MGMSMAKNKELDEFIRASVAAGKSLTDVESVLLEAGWMKEQIEETVGSFYSTEFPVAVPRPVSFASPRLFFLNLAYFLGLYASLWNFSVLGFLVIDSLFAPEVAETSSLAEMLSAKAYDNLSVLIVCIPLVLGLNRKITEAMAETAQQIPRIRLNLIYFTVFAGAFIAFVSVCTFVYWALLGQLTTIVSLKACFVVLILAGVFMYFRGEWKKNEALA